MDSTERLQRIHAHADVLREMFLRPIPDKAASNVLMWRALAVTSEGVVSFAVIRQPGTPLRCLVTSGYARGSAVAINCTQQISNGASGLDPEDAAIFMRLDEIDPETLIWQQVNVHAPSGLAVAFAPLEKARVH